MDTALLAILATLLITWCVVVVALVQLVRAIRRRARAMSERARTSVRACGGAPLAEVARLRQDLRRSTTGVRRALEVARTVGAPVGDVASLLSRLELAAFEVDGELRMLETQPAHRVAAQLAGPRSRAKVIVDTAGHLADGLLGGASRGATDLSMLQAECAIEARALREAQERRYRLGANEPDVSS
jgi:hypothetical protein